MVQHSSVFHHRTLRHTGGARGKNNKSKRRGCCKVFKVSKVLNVINLLNFLNLINLLNVINQ